MSADARRGARLILGLFVPHTAVVLARRLAPRLRSRPRVQIEPTRDAPRFSYDEAVDVLVRRGVDAESVRIGSMPPSAVQFAEDAIARHAPARPLRVLHVGNYVGVSLAALTDTVVRHDAGSVVVSVDPNLPHLGVTDPQRHVLALLTHFGLQRNNVVVCGYSGEKAVVATPAGMSPAEPAGEMTLASLGRLGVRFDVALIDGNHDVGYLRRELDTLLPLMEEGGLLMLDDVSHVYREVRALFDEIAVDPSWPLESLGSDGRLGVLRRTPHAAAS